MDAQPAAELSQSPVMPLASAIPADAAPEATAEAAMTAEIRDADMEGPPEEALGPEGSNAEPARKADSGGPSSSKPGPGGRAASTTAAPAGAATLLQHQPSGASSWAQKHPLPAPVAVAKQSAASPSSSSDSKPTGTAKRRNVFPKVRASERCGKCENCLNPQRKQACTEVRRRQLEQLGQQHKGHAAGTGAGTGATSAQQQPQQRKLAATPAAAADATAADPFQRELKRVLAPSGAVVHTKHVPALLQLMQSARSMAHRYSLLAVLQLSPPDVLRAAVQQRALLPLQAWLSECMATQKPKAAAKVLACLDKLPISTAALQPPCELGKIVGKLRKDERLDATTHEQAKALVAKWKRVVEQESLRDGAAAAAGQATAAKAEPSKPAAAPVSAAKHCPPATTTAAAKPAAAAKTFAAVADDDMFAAADKQRASVKEAAAQQRKVMRIEVEATRGRAAAAAAGSPAQPLSPTAAAAAADEGKGPAAVSLGGPAANPHASKASTSPFESLGASFSAGVSMIGGAGGSLTLSRVGNAFKTASDRAAEAARRVPSPEPRGRKEKRKKVAWVEDAALTAVRWFRKIDPPAAAKADADPSQPLPGGEGNTETEQQEASPPGFEMAAKKEHLSEAEALRRHREEEDEERQELEERLGAMVAAVAWHDPPLTAAATAAAAMEFGVARGEESTEAPAQAVRRMRCPSAVYATLAAVPASPEEPQSAADQGVPQNPQPIPHIPLSLEEAAALQQQQQAQQTHQAPLRQAPPPQQQPQLLIPQQQQQGGPVLLQHQQQPGGLLQLPAHTLPMSLPGMLPPQGQQQQQQAGGMQALPGQLDASALAQLANSGLFNAPPGTILVPMSQPGAPQPPPQQQQPQQQPGPGQFGQPGPILLAPPMPQPGQLLAPNLLPQSHPMAGPPVAAAPPMQLHMQAQQQGVQPPWSQQQAQQGQEQPWQQLQGRHQGQPWQQQQQQGGRGSQHSGDVRRPNIPCKFFNAPSGCSKGDLCRFAHIRGGLGGRGGAGAAAGKRSRAEEENGYERGGAGHQHKQPRTWDSRGPSDRGRH